MCDKKLESVTCDEMLQLHDHGDARTNLVCRGDPHTAWVE